MDQLIVTLQSALDQQSPNNIAATQLINNLLSASSPDLLKMSLYAATSMSAPIEFRSQACLLAKNFLTSRNLFTQKLRQQVWKSLDLTFKNEVIQNLMSQISNQFSFSTPLIGTLINLSPDWIPQVLQSSNQQNSLEIIKILRELTTVNEEIIEFTVCVLEQFAEFFSPENALQGILNVIILLKDKSQQIFPAVEHRINQQFNLLLEKCVNSQQLDWICEILEFYSRVAEKFDLLGFQINGQVFIVQLINLALMFCGRANQNLRLSFIIFELFKKIFSLKKYSSIYESNYVFLVIENAIVQHIQNEVYYDQPQIHELFVVIQELLEIIISNASQKIPDFINSYQQFIYGLNLHQDVSLSQSSQLNQLKYLMLFCPIIHLKQISTSNNLVLQDTTQIIQVIYNSPDQIVSPLLQQALISASFLIKKSPQKHQFMNLILNFAPNLSTDYHLFALDQFLRHFIEIDPDYIQNHLNRIFTQILANKETVNTPSTIVLINNILPTLEQAVNISNYSMLLSTIFNIFQPLQQQFLAFFNPNLTNFLQIILESLNLPLFYSIQNQIILQKNDQQLTQNIIDLVENLIIFYLNQNNFEMENAISTAIEFLTVILHKNEVFLRNSAQLKDILINQITNCDSEISSFCIDLLVQLPNYQPDANLETFLLNSLSNQFSTPKIQNSILVYFWQKIQLFNELPPVEITDFLTAFLSNLQEFDFSDKNNFLLLQSTVLLYGRIFNFSGQNSTEFAFSSQQFLLKSEFRPLVKNEFNESLFSVGYEESLNGLIRVYNSQNQHGLVIGYVSGLKGEIWQGIRENWKGSELEGVISVFQGQFRAILE